MKAILKKKKRKERAETTRDPFFVKEVLKYPKKKMADFHKKIITK